QPSLAVVRNASVASAAQLRAAGLAPVAPPGAVLGTGTGPGSVPGTGPVPGLTPPPGVPGGGSGGAGSVADLLAGLRPVSGLLGPVGPGPAGLPDGPGPGAGAGAAPGGSAPGSTGSGSTGSGNAVPGGGTGPGGTGQGGTASAPAEDPAAARPLEELLAELDGLIGLTRVKEEVHRQAQVLRVEQLRAAAGLRTPTITRHLVFTGNPGTGKTTVARLVAGIYRSLGLLSTGQLVEVDRSELVAGYVGQTATKTAEVTGKALGGVLFVDEAYSLAGDSYGQEAIDTLVKEMEDHRDDLVVIVAGYPLPMGRFIATNPGLASRFRTVIDFDDYTDEELSAIFARLAAGADYTVTEPARERFRELLVGTDRGEGFGNGRFARNILEGAVGRQAWRLREVAEPTVDQLRELLPEDLADPEGTPGDPGSGDDPDPGGDPDTGAGDDPATGDGPGPGGDPAGLGLGPADPDPGPDPAGIAPGSPEDPGTGGPTPSSG
ncbi:MAG: AAA family ATPase, partial [Kineosporiaceae bacterium]